MSVSLGGAFPLKSGVDAGFRNLLREFHYQMPASVATGFAGHVHRPFFPARRRVWVREVLTLTQCSTWGRVPRSSGNEKVGRLRLLPTTAPASRSLLRPKTCSRGTLRASGRSRLLLDPVTHSYLSPSGLSTNRLPSLRLRAPESSAP